MICFNHIVPKVAQKVFSTQTKFYIASLGINVAIVLIC